MSAFIALAFFYLLKRFAFDIVRVNSNDMGATYHNGDALLIKKTANVFALNDVVYIQFTLDDSLLSKTHFIQRIVALPGDSLEISEKQVYVNGTLLNDTSTVKHNYFVKTKNIRLDSLFKLKYRLTEGGEISDEFDYSYSLTRAESELLKNDSVIKSVELKTEKKSSFDETCFPGSIDYKWNMDHYGKIYIPKINDTLRLDTITVKLYSLLLVDHEKNSLKISSDSIFINGQLSSFYVVKKNYYFVLGDNRDNSNDSRILGLLPENFILGKVVGTLRRKNE